MKLIFSIGVFLLGAIVSVNVAHAQISVEVKQAKEEFVKSGVDYQEALDTFNVDKQQYDQIPTNANMETLIAAFKKMVTARTRVWWTFFQGLKVDTSLSTTITAEKKQTITTAIDEQQNSLQDHITKLGTLTDREAILKEVADFKGKSDLFNQIYYPMLVQLKIAKMKRANQEMQNFQQQLATLIPEQIIISQDREQRLRGLADASAQLTQIQTEIETTEKETDSAKQNQAYYLYDNAIKEMNVTYPKIIKTYNLLKELANGIEL
jgi:hypothetical protein